MTGRLPLVDVEAALVAALRPALGVHVSTQRDDNDTPGEAVTLVRVGGATGPWLDRPIVSLDAWAPTTTGAFDLCQRLVTALDALEHTSAGGVWWSSVEVTSTTSYPDPATLAPRWRVTVACSVTEGG